MKIDFRGGLIFTSIEITYKGKTKIIDNIVIDTGASQSLISQDCVDDIGIKFTGLEEVVTSYGIGGKEHAFVKRAESVKLGDIIIENVELDFSSFIYDDINGLLGLDLLMKAGFVIDLKDLAIYQKI